MRRLLLALVWTIGFVARGQSIFTVAGLPYSHRDSIDGKNALSAPLSATYSLLVDKQTGRLLFTDGSLVNRLEPDGSLIAVVGLARDPDGEIADGMLASNLRLNEVVGMAQDAGGALYLSQVVGPGRIFRVAMDGTVTTFAGGGTLAPGFASDGGPATAANLTSPRGIVFDSHGNLILAEAYCQCIRRVSPMGIISTFYKLPPSNAGPFTYFEGLAIDAQDNLYATEYSGSVVLKIAPDGSATTIAGTGVAGFSGDGGPAVAAQLNGPSGVILGPDGNIYITDTMNQRIRRITQDGNISTFAGTGVQGFAGDGGPALNAQFNYPAQMLFDSGGNLYVTDYFNSRVRAIAPNGTISTIAGSGVPDTPPGNTGHGSSLPVGDNGPALHATFNNPARVLVDASGNLYVSDDGDNRVRKIAPDGTIATVAGTGANEDSGVGGLATQAHILGPQGLALDSHGVLYFTTRNSRILKINLDGTLAPVAGNGMGTGPVRSQGDGGPAVDAVLNEPTSVAVDASGNVYIADSTNARLRVVDTNGIINTIWGPAQQGSEYVNAVALDPQGRVYFVFGHFDNAAAYSVIYRLNADGSTVRIAGMTGSRACPSAPVEFPYDGALATDVPLCEVIGLTFDAQGVLYIPYASYGVVLRVNADGTVQRIAGSGSALSMGDGGPALQAGIAAVNVARDAQGNMFLPQNNRVREIAVAPLTLKLSSALVDWQGAGTHAQTVQVVTNMAEPLPYAVKVQTTNGGSWLGTNRVTGLTGEVLAITADSTGLATGVYRGVVSITLPGPGLSVDLPVTLTIP